MPTPVTAKWGSMSDTGIAREPVFGQITTPDSFLPMAGNSLNLDPGLFSPKLMFGHREEYSFPLYGQYKNAGSISGSIFPTNGAALIPGAIGPDAQPGAGVTGTTGTGSTTLAAAAAAGTTSVSLTAQTGLAANQIIQIDVNSATTPTTAECRKIVTLTGTGPYTAQLDVALTYAHASGAAVAGVVAPYTHTIQEAVDLSSFTIEKNLGGPTTYGGESLQFSGARVDKLSISATTTDAEAKLSADMVAQSFTILDSPSPVVIVDESPFVFSEGTVSLFGQTLGQATSFSLDISNGLVSTYTFNQTHDLEYLSPVTLAVTGKLDVVWDSFDDATWGYLTQQTAGTGGAVSFTMTHPGTPTAGSVQLSCPNVRLKMVQEQPKFEDVVTSTLDLVAFLDLTTGSCVGATLVNSAYLPL